MSLEKEAYEKKDSTDLSIQDALIILGVHAANIDPDDCQIVAKLKD